MNVGIGMGWGSVLTVMAAVFKAIANLISKVSLKQIPLGIFSVFRMLVGTVVFFVTVLILYSPAHFMDVTTPFLWKWMLIYSAVIVVGGQFFWFNGLKHSTASEVSLATAFNPIAGILAAYLLLGEIPTSAQYVGGSVILVGIVLNQIGVQRFLTCSASPKTSLKPVKKSSACFWTIYMTWSLFWMTKEKFRTSTGTRWRYLDTPGRT